MENLRKILNNNLINVISDELGVLVDKVIYLDYINQLRVEFNDNHEDFYIGLTSDKFLNEDIERQCLAYKKSYL